MKYLLLILKNVSRNPLRTLLTALGTMMLVFVVTLVWSILSFLDDVTAEKSGNMKVIVVERWTRPSLMPFSYAKTLGEGAARNPGDVRPLDSASWQFYGGSVDPKKTNRENIVFAIALEANKILTMLDELDNLPPEQDAELRAAVDRLAANKHGIILGKDLLKNINKRVGDRFKLYSMNYIGIDLEFEIVGEFPESRYNQIGAMNCEYLNDALDAYGRKPGNLKHPMADRSLNLVWLKVADTDMFSKISGQIDRAPYYSSPAVKVETASSGIAAFLDAFRDLIWGMRRLLAPAALVTLSLVIANSISISVRERRMELAVLKVLGFQPYQILILVLGEATIVGTLAGFASAALTYYIINNVIGGFKFPIGFFGAFFIPAAAMYWGAGMGGLAALAGSIVPAWSARSVKVADVFAKVA
jgi:putative ABC transport system permease protein